MNPERLERLTAWGDPEAIVQLEREERRRGYDVRYLGVLGEAVTSAQGLGVDWMCYTESGDGIGSISAEFGADSHGNGGWLYGDGHRGGWGLGCGYGNHMGNGSGGGRPGWFKEPEYYVRY